MAIEASEARELFEQELNYPVERDTVVETVGEREIEAQGGDDDTIEEIIESGDTAEFESAEALHTTMMNYLDTDHVGREGYSDRSTESTPDDDQDDESL